MVDVEEESPENPEVLENPNLENPEDPDDK
jgi:hypothetical protein